MTIRIRESVLTPISGRGSSFFSGAVHLLNPYVVSPVPDALPLDPIHPVIISPLIVEATPVALPLNEASVTCYVSLGATESLAITPVNPTLAYFADRLHESVYKTFHAQVHYTSYQSETGTAKLLHEVYWSNASFAIHESSYCSLVASLDQAYHTALWASIGGATAENQLHEVSWASTGSAEGARAFHTTSYQSWQLTPAFAQHDTSWASLGGASSAFQLNAVSWASLGSSSAFNLHETTWQSLVGSTSAAHLHETSWQSLGGASSASSFHTISWTWSPAIRRQHDVLWKSIESHERFHTTAWNSDTSIHRLHEARYRSNTTTPMIIDSLFYVRV